jgi:Protein of unknown function (DUF3455)
VNRWFFAAILVAVVSLTFAAFVRAGNHEPSDRLGQDGWKFSERTTLSPDRTTSLREACGKAPGDLPVALSVPATECLKKRVTGVGFQIYACQVGSWVLKAPEANLTMGGKFVGNHFLGPTWQWRDGSKLKASKTASAPGATAADVPWLLLTVTKEEGAGELAGTKHILRIATKGGSPPTVICSNATAEVAVPYEAEYLFYSAR